MLRQPVIKYWSMVNQMVTNLNTYLPVGVWKNNELHFGHKNLSRKHICGTHLNSKLKVFKCFKSYKNIV